MPRQRRRHRWKQRGSDRVYRIEFRRRSARRPASMSRESHCVARRTPRRPNRQPHGSDRQAKTRANPRCARIDHSKVARKGAALPKAERRSSAAKSEEEGGCRGRRSTRRLSASDVRCRKPANAPRCTHGGIFNPENRNNESSWPSAPSARVRVKEPSFALRKVHNFVQLLISLLPPFPRDEAWFKKREVRAAGCCLERRSIPRARKLQEGRVCVGRGRAVARTFSYSSIMVVGSPWKARRYGGYAPRTEKPLREAPHTHATKQIADVNRVGYTRQGAALRGARYRASREY
ncbi:hypothetical protein B0H11DRAFT_1935685 [Mycena galericulata]|nr:hypothetical protein B0H11DRAFT_1935685 [Mycena galericulata]